MPDVPTWEDVLPETPDHGYINTATLSTLMSAWERLFSDPFEHHAAEQN